MTSLDAALTLAREVEEHFRAANEPLLLIGATALAAHGYPRHTEDIDFAVAMPPRDLERLADTLRSSERTVAYSAPDPSDPLGGVVTVSARDCLPVQVVNFDNPPAGGFPALVRDSLERSSARDPQGTPGRLPTPEDLILFKVYAGGPKSELDILEFLTRCRVDLPALRKAARGYGISEALEQVLACVPIP
jgi:hypothetical protein